MKPNEKPTQESFERTPGETATRERHPAYALLQVSRLSGNATLFDSDFKHQHYITLRIKKAEVDRHLSNDWIHEASGAAYAEISLSESQWATAISSLNSGTGTPCTLERINGEAVPGIQRPEHGKDQIFADELQKTMGDALDQINRLQESVETFKLSKKSKQGLSNQLSRLASGISGSIEFVASSSQKN